MHVDRLDAEPIAREQEGLPDRVEQCKCPHTDKALDARRAPLLIGAQNDLGVAVGAEHVAQFAELGADLDVIVDLAVGDQRQTAVFAAHWHVAERTEVENAQALTGQRTAAHHGLAAGVRAAVVLAGRHCLECRHVLEWDRLTIEAVDACNAAHGTVSSDRPENERQLPAFRAASGPGRYEASRGQWIARRRRVRSLARAARSRARSSRLPGGVWFQRAE